ncbi:MAG TPA: hypothetical protein PK916_02890 [Bacteroidota bacterium]|nr:hypothetical protein [Bacteroidota bacterium]
MKRLITLAALFALTLVLTVANSNDASAQNRPANKGFVDLNNDGINDNALDDDGDGIPNGKDPDYTGTKLGTSGRGFVDDNGDGINDNAPDADGDGIPNGQDPDFQRGTGSGSPAGKGLRGGSPATGGGTPAADGTGMKNARRGK